TPSPETVHAHDVSWRKWRRYQRWKYVAMLLGGVLLGLMVCAVIVLVVVVIGQNSKLVTLAKQNHDNTENTPKAVQILVDCTTPGHSCYEKGQQSTRTAVQGLNAAADARAICAQDTANDTVTKLEASRVKRPPPH